MEKPVLEKEGITYYQQLWLQDKICQMWKGKEIKRNRIDIFHF